MQKDLTLKSNTAYRAVYSAQSVILLSQIPKRRSEEASIPRGPWLVISVLLDSYVELIVEIQP